MGDQYQRAFAELKTILAPYGSNVLYLGSVVRGEYRYYYNSNNTLIGLSDIEAIVFGIKNEFIIEKILELEKKYQNILGPIFTVDVDFVPIWRVVFLRNRFIFFEGINNDTSFSKILSSIILGKKLDKNELNQSIVWRFFNLHMRLLSKPKSGLKNYYIARNILDLHAVILYNSGFYLPTIEKRRQHFLSNSYNLNIDKILHDSYHIYGLTHELSLTLDPILDEGDFMIFMDKALGFLETNSLKMLPPISQSIKSSVLQFSLTPIICRLRMSNRAFYRDIRRLSLNGTKREIVEFKAKYTPVMQYLSNY